MNKPLTRLALGLAVLASTSSLAQTPAPVAPDEPAPIHRYSARTNVIFTDAEIEGAMKGPSGTIYVARKKVGFRNLIELRSNFRPELSSSKDGL